MGIGEQRARFINEFGDFDAAQMAGYVGTNEPALRMRGINVSQGRAFELSDRFEIYLDQDTGFWVRTDGVDSTTLTYTICRTGDRQQDIPESAWQFEFELTLIDAAKETGIAYSTLAQAVREGRLDARQSGATWLTTREAVDRAIAEGKLRPRK